MHRFSNRQVRFLELYLNGLTMAAAAEGAGYQGSTSQSLCNTARAILDKFTADPKAFFLQAEVSKRKIVQLLFDMTNSKSEHQQLKALKILAGLL